MKALSIENPQRIEKIKCNGNLGFWEFNKKWK